MGGLAKPMPRTAAMFLIGAVAICGLPPLNGFVSELLIYAGLFRSIVPSGGPTLVSLALAVPCLALIGALALACFVKAYGAVFLGQARSERAAHAHEAPMAMTGPMMILGGCCVALGLAPMAATPLLERIVRAWPCGAVPAGSSIASSLPLEWISILGISLLGLIALSSFLLSYRLSAAAVPAVGTWDCGYAQPSARMQYTSSSFAQMVVGLLRAVLRPRFQRPGLGGHFPKESHFHSHVDDVVLDGFVYPTCRKLADRIGRIRIFQHGRVQEYILYILVALLLLLLWILPLDELVRRVFTR
jgi:hydrogenase-4 component B